MDNSWKIKEGYYWKEKRERFYAKFQPWST
jgi:hypothetical protein